MANNRPRRVALGTGASENRRIDAARRWSGAAAESNGSDCWSETGRIQQLPEMLNLPALSPYLDNGLRARAIA